MKILATITITVVGILIVAIGGFFLLSTIMRYRPSPIENAVIKKEINSPRIIPDTLSILTWNIGFASLGKEADFFIMVAPIPGHYHAEKLLNT